MINILDNRFKSAKSKIIIAVHYYRWIDYEFCLLQLNFLERHQLAQNQLAQKKSSPDWELFF